MLSVLVTVIAFLVGSSFYRQAWIMWKHQTGFNVSKYVYVLLIISNVLWFAYGLQIHSWPLIITNVFSFGGNALVLAMHYRFRQSPRGDAS